MSCGYHGHMRPHERDTSNTVAVVEEDIEDREPRRITEYNDE